MSLDSALPIYDPSKVPALNASHDEKWAYLKQSIDHIMAHPDGLSAVAHTSIYTAVYNSCGFGAPKNQRFASGPPVVKDPGSKLYNNLEKYLMNYCEGLQQKLKSLFDDDLLKSYAEDWERFIASAKKVDRVFAPLNRYWIKRERDEARSAEKLTRLGRQNELPQGIVRKEVFPVYTLALYMWRAHLVLPLQEANSKLTKTILHFITIERKGEPIDTASLKITTTSFVALGLHVPPDPESLDFYQTHVEAPLLAATQMFYLAEADVLLTEPSSAQDYVTQVDVRLHRERELADACLHPSTREELVRQCADVLVGRHLDVFLDAFSSGLEGGRDDDVQRVYQLLADSPEWLEALVGRFQEHVACSKRETLSQHLGRAGQGVESPELNVDAAGLLEIRQKNLAVVESSFQGDPRFIAGLEKAMENLKL